MIQNTYHVYFAILYFGSLLVLKWACVTDYMGPKSCSAALGGPFGSTVISKSFNFNFFRREPSLNIGWFMLIKVGDYYKCRSAHTSPWKYVLVMEIIITYMMLYNIHYTCIICILYGLQFPPVCIVLHNYCIILLYFLRIYTRAFYVELNRN